MKPHCRTPAACIAKGDKHCSPCTLAAKWKDPEFREKRRVAFARKLAEDVEFRTKHVAACQARMEEWRNRPDVRLGENERSLANLAIANTPEAHARRTASIRMRAYRGIPVERHDECRNLARRVGADEAKRIIREDEAAQARRGVEAVTAAMRAKARRQKAQAY